MDINKSQTLRGCNIKIKDCGMEWIIVSKSSPFVRLNPGKNFWSQSFLQEAEAVVASIQWYSFYIKCNYIHNTNNFIVKTWLVLSTRSRLEMYNFITSFAMALYEVSVEKMANKRDIKFLQIICALYGTELKWLAEAHLLCREIMYHALAQRRHFCFVQNEGICDASRLLHSF